MGGQRLRDDPDPAYRPGSAGGFQNGDPDLPIIVGRTYNQDTMPPWGLPGAATQSGIYSHTIGGGPTNANALRFEDKPGSEEVWLHAEKISVLKLIIMKVTGWE